MKKIILPVLSFFLCFSCSKEEVLEVDSVLNPDLYELSFIYEGEKLTMQVDLSTGEPLYSQTEDFIKINDILSSENAVTYINPEFEFPVIFENEKAFGLSGVVSSNFTNTSKQNVSNEDLKIRSSEEMSFTIYEHSAYRGLSHKVTWNPSLTTDIDHRTYQNPNLKVCFPFNINFNDRISSLKLKNCYVAMYEHPDFAGKRIIWDGRVLTWWPADYSVSSSNLHAFSFRNKGSVGDMTPGTDDCTNYFCRDWGDKASSIYATVGDSPLTPNRSLDLDCYDKSYRMGGGSSGGGGNGGGGMGPRDEHDQ